MKNTNYSIMVKIELFTDMEISAKSFEEALQKARELKVTDVVSFDGSHNDSSIEVTGVFK